MNKDDIRKNILKERSLLSESQRREFNQAIYQRLINSDLYQKSKIIFAFASFGSEVDTWTILDHAMHEGKRVYLPRVEGKIMNFYELKDIQSLEPSKFGILEPKTEEANRYLVETDPNQIKVMIMPGLAFDTKGNRIGYGAGYYDKYLNSFPKDHFIKAAIAYDFQIFDYLVSDPYDIPVDIIITPSKYLPIK
ncbi:MAG TPA: 5-formyltetrahydrofolate cyclo-ligase [Clostridiales bacterium]|nr:5-formyltetrahydrofolate cyclo-ligase [Clostridiales bacterium]